MNISAPPVRNQTVGDGIRPRSDDGTSPARRKARNQTPPEVEAGAAHCRPCNERTTQCSDGDRRTEDATVRHIGRPVRMNPTSWSLPRRAWVRRTRVTTSPRCNRVVRQKAGCLLRSPADDPPHKHAALSRQICNWANVFPVERSLCLVTINVDAFDRHRQQFPIINCSAPQRDLPHFAGAGQPPGRLRVDHSVCRASRIFPSRRIAFAQHTLVWNQRLWLLVTSCDNSPSLLHAKRNAPQLDAMRAGGPPPPLLLPPLLLPQYRLQGARDRASECPATSP